MLSKQAGRSLCTCARKFGKRSAKTFLFPPPSALLLQGNSYSCQILINPMVSEDFGCSAGMIILVYIPSRATLSMQGRTIEYQENLGQYANHVLMSTWIVTLETACFHGVP